MGVVSDLEIPLLLTLSYLFCKAGPRVCCFLFKGLFINARLVWKTYSGGEFGWGGTSVK